MVDSIKNVKAGEVTLKAGEAKAKEAEKTKQEKSVWENIKSEVAETADNWGIYLSNSDMGKLLKGDFKGAVEMWKSLPSFLYNSDLGHLLRGNFRESFEIFMASNKDWETKLGLNILKNPIKAEFKKLEKAVDDGDDKKLTTSEKMVEFAKSTGEIADSITTPLGIASTVLGGAALKAAGGAAKIGIEAGAAKLMTAGYIKTAAVVSAAPAVASSTAVVGGTAVTGVGAVQIATADTKEEVKTGANTTMLGLSVLGLGLATAKPSVEIAKAGGIPVADGANPLKEIFTIPVKSVTTPTSEIQANALSHATGMIQPGATVLKQDVFEAQANSPAREVYKFDPSGSTPEEVLAKNPYVSYDKATGKYYVKTSWGENMYIDAKKDYMICKYGDGDYNAIEGLEFAKTYVEPTAYNASGAKNFIDPSKLKPGEQILASKAEAARFKLMPAGTKYMSAEGPATLQDASVLMIDKKGRPYQNTIEFLLKNNKGFSEEGQIELCKAIKQYANTINLDPKGTELAKQFGFREIYYSSTNHRVDSEYFQGYAGPGCFTKGEFDSPSGYLTYTYKDQVCNRTVLDGIIK